MLRRDLIRAASAAAGVSLFPRIVVAASESLAGAQIRIIVLFQRVGRPTLLRGLSPRRLVTHLRRRSWSTIEEAPAAPLEPTLWPSLRPMAELC